MKKITMRARSSKLSGYVFGLYRLIKVLPCAINVSSDMKRHEQKSNERRLWACGYSMRKRNAHFYKRMKDNYYRLMYKIRSGMRHEFIQELLDIINRSKMEIPRSFVLLFEAAKANDTQFELYALAFMYGIFSEKGERNNQTEKPKNVNQ